MELMDVISGRRAVREFAADPVDRATVQRLIDGAILAPSAMNLQPWRSLFCSIGNVSRRTQSVQRIGCL